MNEATRSFLKLAYKEYYFRRADAIEFPDELQAREFGYIPFGGSMVRHLAFRGPGEAVAEIVRQTPSSVYCSNARYESPSAPMEQKVWKGAELIFDIDATDIPTACKKGHDLWFCENCHWSAKLPKPIRCPKCGGNPEEFHGTCGICLTASKDHTLRVVDMLIGDFGVSKDKIQLYFSGNRGYHVHVLDHRFYLLDQVARAEVSGYVRGDSLPALQSIASVLRRRPNQAAANSLGWMKKIITHVESKKSTYSGTLQKLVSEAVYSNRALVDAAVTTDIHRVFRLAGTLHGTTGMCKLRLKSPESFNSETDPVVLSSEPVKLNVGFFPQFTLKGGTFGPYKNSIEVIPTYAAVAILTRGLGEVE